MNVRTVCVGLLLGFRGSVESLTLRSRGRVTNDLIRTLDMIDENVKDMSAVDKLDLGECVDKLEYWTQKEFPEIRNHCE